MKRISILIIGVLMAFSASAQKYLLQSAKNYFGSGELKLAKQYIDQASDDAALSQNAETWVFKGLIYQSIYEDSTKQSIEPNSLYEALPFFKKATELDTKKEYSDKIVPALNQLRIDFFNKAVRYLQKNGSDNADAYPNFEKALEVSNYLEVAYKGSPDTLSLFNTAFTAMNLNKLDTAKMLFGRLVTFTYNLNNEHQKNTARNSYIDYADIAQRLKDTTEAQADLRKAETIFPNDEPILMEDLNISFQRKQYDDAIVGLNNAVKIDPTNAQLYYYLGITYEKKKDYTNAEANYRKAVELNPKNVEAQYSIGALFFNRAVEINKAMGDLGTTAADQTKYNDLKKQSDDLFAKALPELEKAYQLNPKDKETLRALVALYTRTSQMDKAKQYQAELDAVTGGGK